jgi:hypothetical protein
MSICQIAAYYNSLGNGSVYCPEATLSLNPAKFPFATMVVETTWGEERTLFPDVSCLQFMGVTVSCKLTWLKLAVNVTHIQLYIWDKVAT